MKPIDERLEDETILPLMFLWEPYKPSLWFWEVIETTRRLMMTGVLSVIEPGSFSQLIAGLMMNIAYIVLLCLIRPYNETRDNAIAILTTLQLIFIFVASMSLKVSLELTTSNDSKGLGLLLITSQVIIAALFVAWAAWQKDDMSTSASSMASKTLRNLKGQGRKKEEKKTGDVAVDVDGLELTDLGFGEAGARDNRNDRSSSSFQQTNPLAKQDVKKKKKKKKKGEDGEGEGEEWEIAHDDEGNQYFWETTTGRTSWTEKPVTDSKT